MATLQDIKKERKLTNAVIGKQLGCSASRVGMMLQGRHIHVIEDQEIERLAQILGITFERCWLAMQESYNVWSGSSLDANHARPAEFQYKVAQDMGLESFLDVPRSTSIDGVMVVDASRQIEQGVK